MRRVRRAVRAWALASFAAAGCESNVNDGGVVQGVTERVNVSSAGAQADRNSDLPRISADGRYSVFTSLSSALVPNDGGGTDVFRHDRLTRTTERVSVDTVGGDANGSSSEPSISGDGRYVAFRSSAANLVAGDTNGFQDIFVRDMVLGATVRASVEAPGNPDAAADGANANGSSFNPVISEDGRFVVFASEAEDVVAGDSNTDTDVFRRDLVNNVTIRISVTTAGAQVVGNSAAPAVSADGSVVAFLSDSAQLVAGDTNGLIDVFVRDLTGAPFTERVSVEPPGGDGAADGENTNGPANSCSISGDGRYVAFESWAPDIVAGKVQTFAKTAIVRDRVLDVNINASVNSDGLEATQDSFLPSISADGRFVAFHSPAPNLVQGDTNGADDVFVRDLILGTTERVSVSTFGNETPLNQLSTQGWMSGDGRFVAFASQAFNLVNGDTNGVVDIFVRGPLR